MVSPVREKRFQAQNTGSATPFNRVFDQDGILAVNHHDCFMDAEIVSFIDKMGTMILVIFRKRKVPLGVKDARILTT
jgi:hypothetical protein